MRRVALLAVIVLLLTCSFVVANPSYYATLGMSKPFAPDDFQKNWRAGFNIGAAIGYSFSSHLEVQGEFLYDNFPLDDLSYLGDFTDVNSFYASVSGGTASLLGFYANVKYLSPLQKDATLTPYLIGELGLGTLMIGEREVTTESEMFTVPQESQTALATGLGLGVEIVMGGRTSFVVEGRFNVLLTDETTVYFPLKLGIVIH